MNISHSFDFQHGESPLRLRLDLPGNLQQQFDVAPRSFSYSGSLPPDWKQRYFQMFLTHAADRASMQAVIGALRGLAAGAGNDSLLELAIAFVQSAISYDYVTAYKISGGKIHYPSETLLDRKGVCADKTILLAAILQQLGYRIAIFTWERANHMALGLAVPSGQGSFGTEFAMVETTAPTAIGTVPDRYMGGIRLDGKPEVVTFGPSGQAYQGLAAQRKHEQQLAEKYGAEYVKLPLAQQAIFRQMHPLKAEMEALNQQLKGCKGTLAPAQFAICQKLQAEHNAKVEHYNRLVAQFNAAK